MLNFCLFPTYFLLSQHLLVTRMSSYWKINWDKGTKLNVVKLQSQPKLENRFFCIISRLQVSTWNLSWLCLKEIPQRRAESMGWIESQNTYAEKTSILKTIKNKQTHIRYVFKIFQDRIASRMYTFDKFMEVSKKKYILCNDKWLKLEVWWWQWIHTTLKITLQYNV